MGESRFEALRLQFEPSLRLEFHGASVTSDAGLLAYRELDEVLDLTAMGSARIADPRTGSNTRHSLTALLRQAVYGRLAGYEDTNDAERLRFDPAARQVVGGRAREKEAASTSEMGWFETEVLTRKEHLRSLLDLPGEWIDRVQTRTGASKRLVLDMDSSESETYGDQQGSAFNGHFDCTCYHPLFLFNQDGDLERCLLRRGNRYSSKYWRRVLCPVIERYRGRSLERFFRGDAAFEVPGLMKVLEAEKFGYAIRIKQNAVLLRAVEHLLTRPVGRPSRQPKVFYHSFMYRAGSWDRERRIVAKVEWHMGELLPRIGFIVTNLRWRSKRVVKFYNQRGTAEQWIKEGKHAVKWTKLSCHDFKDNQVRLQLFALAYNQGNFLRRLALPRSVKHWSLTTLREKLVKIGAKVVKHARYINFQMAEVAVPRELFASILAKIGRLRDAPA
ncbi:MAG: IS1380 family transposase [Planctomycetes bacterium]|nr:IS1380 family transposase [Planctomycetota bacterium]